MEEYAGLIYWSSFLLLPLLAGLLLGALRGHWVRRLFAVFLAIPVALVVYGRFIEPQRLIQVFNEVEICGQGLPGTIKAAVLADLHQGAFRNAVSTKRVVRMINRSGADIVLIAGDFTYELPAEKFDRTFEAFQKLDAPAYAVLGNHDNWEGEEYRTELIAALEKQGVTMLAPGEEIFRKNGKFLRIVGTRDLDSALHERLPFGEFPEPGGMPSIVITHNPDIIRSRKVGHYDLMVAGHTHGGQVMIPGVTCEITGACKTLRYGLAETPTGQLFVTSGTGMVALPVRFNVEPRVDMLNIKISRCRAKPFGDVLRVFPHDQGAQ
ncbi:MAG: metallophosphoesterase [Pseudomonadota bacterium]